MGLYEYMMLTQEQQWDELWDNGKHITNYKSIDCSFSLYALHRFYVEVELCVSSGKILGKGIFKTGKTLDKYAGSIDINAI